MKWIIYILLLVILISPVSADIPTPSISSISPSSIPNTGTTTLTIHGSGFTSSTWVYIQACGMGSSIGNINTETPTMLIATFTFAGQMPGTWNLRIYNDVNHYTIHPFTVTGVSPLVIPTSTPVPTQTSSVIYTTETPGYSTTTAEPDVTEVYIYNIPVPTTLVPISQRGDAIIEKQPTQPQPTVPSIIKPISTIKPKPIPVTTKSPVDISIIIISLLLLIKIIKH